MLCAIILSIESVNFIPPHYVGGTSASIIDKRNELSGIIKSNYNSNYKDITVDYEDIIVSGGSKNLSQSALNNEYNKNHDIQISDTCAEVGTTILIEYKNFEENKLKNDEEIFTDVMDKAIDNNFWDIDEGYTQSNNIAKLLKKSINIYNKNLKVKDVNPLIFDRTIIMSNIRNNIKNNNTMLLVCKNHTMHVVGCITCTVKYSKKFLFFDIKGTDKFEYLIVNDGWQDASSNEEDKQYSYYPVNEIGARFRLSFAQK